MLKIVRTPHDNFVKAMMEHPEVASDFFMSNLPQAILAQVDLSTLRMENTTFIDAKLRKNESDLIFSVKLLNLSDAHIYLNKICLKSNNYRL